MVTTDSYFLFGCGTDLNPSFGLSSANGFKVWIETSPARSIKYSITFKNHDFGSNGDPEYYQLIHPTNIQVAEGAYNHLVISLNAQQSIDTSLNGTTDSKSIQFTYAGDSSFRPHMSGDWHLGAVNEDFSRKDFFGEIVDFRGYNKALTSSEITELSSGGKGPQLACDAGNPNAPEVLLVDSVDSGSELTEFELRPLRVIAEDVESVSQVDEFYVLPIDLQPQSVDSLSEAEGVAPAGLVTVSADSSESKTLVSGIFTVDAKVPLLVDSAECPSEAKAVSLPAVSKVIFIDSSESTSESEAVYLPLVPGDQVVSARSVDATSECSSPSVTVTGESDAYLIYCPSRSYDYANTAYLPDLSGNHSPTSSGNSDILWQKVDDEWAIDMRQTENAIDPVTNAVEIKVDSTESINSLGSPSASPDEPFSISMHFMFDQWPDQVGNTSTYPTCMGLYNFVVPDSYVQSPIEYFNVGWAGVRVYVTRSYSGSTYRIGCQLLAPDASYWQRRYTNSLSSVSDLPENVMHHLAVTYDGTNQHGMKIFLNGTDVSGSTSGTISSPSYNTTSTYSDFSQPEMLRKAFIGRVGGKLPTQGTQYLNPENVRDIRGEAVPYWDDFRYFREALNQTQVSYLSQRGVGLPARYELSIPQVGSPAECSSVFSPVTFGSLLDNADSHTEAESLFTVGFGYETDPSSIRSFTRVESPDVIRHKGVPAHSVESSTECGTVDVIAAKSAGPFNAESSTESSRPFVSKSVQLSIKSIDQGSEVSSPTLSGDGVLVVDGSVSPSETSSPDVRRNIYLVPSGVDSQSITSIPSLAFGYGLDPSGSESPSEADDVSVEANYSLSVTGVESGTETEGLFFFTDKTIQPESATSTAESEEFSIGIGTSLPDALAVESSSEVEDFALVAAAVLEIASVDSISESGDATLTFVLNVEAQGVDVGSEAESPYVSHSPIGIASVDCAAEVKGLTLPDLSNIKKGPPKLFLESDLIIGDY
jgi:hypothetical protein